MGGLLRRRATPRALGQPRLLCRLDAASLSCTHVRHGCAADLARTCIILSSYESYPCVYSIPKVFQALKPCHIPTGPLGIAVLLAAQPVPLHGAVTDSCEAWRPLK